MKHLLIILLLGLANFLFSQSSYSSHTSGTADIKVDKQPEYPGGKKALIKILIDSVEEPGVQWENANDDDVKVVMTFYIDEHGATSDVQVTKSTEPKYNPKFIAAIKKLKFTPAILDGKPVKVKYTLPFTVEFGDRTKY